MAGAASNADLNQQRQNLPELLRNAIASLALALGFAALARRPGEPVMILPHRQRCLN